MRFLFLALVLVGCSAPSQTPALPAPPPHMRAVASVEYDWYRDLVEFADEEHHTRCWVVVYHGESVAISCLRDGAQ